MKAGTINGIDFDQRLDDASVYLQHTIDTMFIFERQWSFYKETGTLTITDRSMPPAAVRHYDYLNKPNAWAKYPGMSYGMRIKNRSTFINLPPQC